MITKSLFAIAASLMTLSAFTSTLAVLAGGSPVASQTQVA